MIAEYCIKHTNGNILQVSTNEDKLLNTLRSMRQSQGWDVVPYVDTRKEAVFVQEDRA